MAKIFTQVELEHTDLVTLITEKARQLSGVREGSVVVRFKAVEANGENHPKVAAVVELNGMKATTK